LSINDDTHKYIDEFIKPFDEKWQKNVIPGAELIMPTAVVLSISTNAQH